MSVFYPFSSAKSSTGASLSNYLIATIIYWCWFARNRATFGNSLLPSDKVIDLIKRDIQLRIRGDCTDSVKNFWSFKNALCSIRSNGDLCFLPSL